MLGFAVQRVLTDIIAGFAMFAERWYAVGDTIAVPGLELQGVVEDVSLRRTRLRTLDGESIHIHNSQIPAVKVLPRGVKELGIELFVSERERGEELVAAMAALLPEGPTTFVRKPWIDTVEELSPSLVRIALRATTAPGREWLVDGFFTDLLQRAGRARPDRARADRARGRRDRLPQLRPRQRRDALAGPQRSGLGSFRFLELAPQLVDLGSTASAGRIGSQRLKSR